ncbi:hypothetical protein [Amycolatopsis pittospori]|uniref:hypothetical protein n=1 Tax=Amycolatopsis pittospori TaxID=2749434 RepID=UPI001F19670E|nr:hypothetical protein [Amycolatopsis pittospori]
MNPKRCGSGGGTWWSESGGDADLELPGFAQALMRFGYPSGTVPSSPRRAVDELLGRGF